MKAPLKPVGYAPREIDGITVRKSSEMPVGVQALYNKGVLLGVFHIGERVPAVQADAITLHPMDYELVVKSYLERKQRDRQRRFKGGIVKAPKSADIERVLREGRDRQN
jgi:hypothetical protein